MRKLKVDRLRKRTMKPTSFIELCKVAAKLSGRPLSETLHVGAAFAELICDDFEMRVLLVNYGRKRKGLVLF
jgi:hypothetical protein